MQLLRRRLHAKRRPERGRRQWQRAHVDRALAIQKDRRIVLPPRAVEEDHTLAHLTNRHKARIHGLVLRADAAAAAAARWSLLVNDAKGHAGQRRDGLQRVLVRPQALTRAALLAAPPREFACFLQIGRRAVVHEPFVAFDAGVSECLHQFKELLRDRIGDSISHRARVGEHFNVKRVPVIKKQGISAYDPRVIEVTGISMMLTAQGADHTAGNLPAYDCKDKTTEELTRASMDIQTNCAAVDSLGICVFGRSVTNVNHDFIVEALNNALGTELDTKWFYDFGIETLKLEAIIFENLSNLY